jgi:hypothetical protein
MNRWYRRMLRFGRSASEPGSKPDLTKASTPQDVTSVRAKNSGHGKKTADKWNQ